MRTLYCICLVHTANETLPVESFLKLVNATSEEDEKRVRKAYTTLFVDSENYGRALNESLIEILRNSPVFASDGSMLQTLHLYLDGFHEQETWEKRKTKIGKTTPLSSMIDQLLALGANLLQTEDLRRMDTFLNAVAAANRSGQKPLDKFTRGRDRYIARRISETLKEGECGLLFIGALHDVERFLPSDISVQYLHRADTLSEQTISTYRLRERNITLSKPDSFGHTLPLAHL